MATLKAQLVEKQAVQSENDRLKLQLDSMQAQNQMEQRKAGEERSEATYNMYRDTDCLVLILNDLSRKMSTLEPFLLAF